MKLTASQLRQIIREELSESRRNPAGRFKVGNEGFETQAEAEAYADKIAGESGWESNVNVVDTSTEMAVYTAGEGAKGQLIDEGPVTPAHKSQARAMVAGTSLQGMVGLVNDIAQAIADGKWNGSNAEIRRMDNQGYWGGAIVKNLTR